MKQDSIYLGSLSLYHAVLWAFFMLCENFSFHFVFNVDISIYFSAFVSISQRLFDNAKSRKMTNIIINLIKLDIEIKHAICFCFIRSLLRGETLGFFHFTHLESRIQARGSESPLETRKKKTKNPKHTAIMEEFITRFVQT